MSNESENELEKLKATLDEIASLLWHHCLEDESENELMMRAYPKGPKDVPAYLVNAQMIDDIYQMCKGYIHTFAPKGYTKPCA